MKHKICVIIPAYNEEAVIAHVVEGITKALTKKKYKFEIIVVNDGSNDDTAEAAKKAGAHVINHILNSGAGGATATGLSYAEQNGFSIAATMDADGQHSPDDVIKGVETILESNADLLIGSRLIDSSGMSRVKILGNRGLSFITWIIFGVNSTDSQSGLRIFSTRALERLRWRTNGYEFCSEMLWRAKQSGLHIEEYSISAIYSDYSRAKGQSNWNAFNIINSLLKRRLTELLNE